MPRTPRYWTPEEDVILRKAMTLCTEGDIVNWCRIAAQLPGRTNKDCRKRWHNAVAAGLNKGQWTKDEDERLRRGVREYGLRKWPQVAEVVGSRSADQCAKRWHQSLNPELDHSEWTAAENDRLLQAVSTLGRQWTLIQGLHFQGRSKNAIKNRYSVLTRKLQNSAQGSPSKVHSSSVSTVSTSSRAPSQAEGNNEEDEDNADEDDDDDDDENDEFFPDADPMCREVSMQSSEPPLLGHNTGTKDFLADGHLFWGVESASDFALSNGSPATSLLGLGFEAGDITFDSPPRRLLPTVTDGTAPSPAAGTGSGRLGSLDSSTRSLTDPSHPPLLFPFTTAGAAPDDLMQIEPPPLSPDGSGTIPTRAHFTLTINQPNAKVTQSLMQIAIETRAKFRIQWE